MNFSNSVDVAVVVIVGVAILMFSLISSSKWDINLSTSSSTNIHIYTNTTVGFWSAFITTKCLATKTSLSQMRRWIERVRAYGAVSFQIFDDKIRPNRIWSCCEKVVLLFDIQLHHCYRWFLFLFCRRMYTFTLRFQAGRKTGIGKWKQDTQQTLRTMMMLMKL